MADGDQQAHRRSQHAPAAGGGTALPAAAESQPGRSGGVRKTDYADFVAFPADAVGGDGAAQPVHECSSDGGLPPSGLARTTSQASSYRYDDEDEGQSYYEPASGRGTPAQGRYSQPGTDGRSSSNGDLRPRARTEDQDSAVMAQWRSHSPAVPPPLPRGLSYSSGADQHGLRKASSSRQLRQPNAGTGAKRPCGRRSVEYLDGSSDSADSFKYGTSRPRGDSTASSMSRTTSDNGAAHSRSRSASNPQMFVLPPHMQGAAPPLPKLPLDKTAGGGQSSPTTTTTGGTSASGQGAAGIRGLATARSPRRNQLSRALPVHNHRQQLRHPSTLPSPPRRVTVQSHNHPRQTPQPSASISPSRKTSLWSSSSHRRLTTLCWKR